MLAFWSFAPVQTPAYHCHIDTDQSVEGHDYAFCQTVQIDGTLHGDLVTLANTVIVNGSVEGDVLAAANQVMINGSVGGSIRVLTAELRIGPSAMLRGKHSDVAALGLHLESSAPLPADVWFAGREAVFNSAVAGQKHIFLVPNPPNDLPNTVANYLSATLHDWFALLIIGLIAFVIAPKPLLVTTEAFQPRCFLFGGILLALLFPAALVLVIVSLLVVIVLSLLSLGQLTLILSLLFAALDITLISLSVFVVGFLSRLIVAYALGRWIGRRAFSDADRATTTFLSMVTGTLICAGLSNLPYVGIFGSLLIGVSGTGMIYIVAAHRLIAPLRIRRGVGVR